MTVALWSVSIGVSYEVLFIYCFQYTNKSGLDKLVFKAWYPQGALCVAARLWYIFPPDRLRYVCHPVQFCFRRLSASVSGRRFLTPRCHVWSPFLRRHYPPSSVLQDHPTPCALFAFLPLRLSGILPPLFRGESRYRASRVG